MATKRHNHRVNEICAVATTILLTAAGTPNIWIMWFMISAYCLGKIAVSRIAERHQARVMGRRRALRNRYYRQYTTRYAR